MTTMATTNAAGVFQLYQEGLGPDQVLQLCFTRRRSPRRLQTEHTRAEDAFVLPRPALEIGSVMPLVEVSLQQLVEESLLATSTHSSLKATTDATVTQAKESVKKHFLLPREAEDEELEQWSALQEADWLSVWHSLQSRQDQDDEMTGEALVDPVALPDIADFLS
ncbi:hypothetical protein PHYBOEH_003655 [Phytophthora boehmeriae]|uniref:Uncharacterized protein n=1 Tax=Phytophthora boehmeriae TaxID=109152 RepID=A0A8T1WPZ2_9STRA|nr:hypothetical protein PHYBOEH_003655 [Phytophthora boehmeriae]